jgi:peptidoglycan/LPS O-acetylase OafA/YrhL
MSNFSELSPWWTVLFVVGVWLFAHGSYRYFERPLDRCRGKVVGLDQAARRRRARVFEVRHPTLVMRTNRSRLGAAADAGRPISAIGAGVHACCI